MSRFRFLFLWVWLFSLSGCRPGADTLPNALIGTYTFYAPFYQNGATIKFGDGNYSAQGKVENSEFGTMEFTGHYGFSGNKLHLTFDEVSTNSASETNQFTKDLLEENAERLRKVKSLDFIVIAKKDGVLAITSSSTGPGPAGETNFVLDPGNTALSQGVTVSITWLPSFGELARSHKLSPGDSTFNPITPLKSGHRPLRSGAKMTDSKNAAEDASDTPMTSTPPDSQGSDTGGDDSDSSGSGDASSGSGTG